jgi:hypothetical protein
MSRRMFVWDWMDRAIKFSDFVWLLAVTKFEEISIQTNYQEIKNNHGAVFWSSTVHFHMLSLKHTKNYGFDYIWTFAIKMTEILLYLESYDSHLILFICMKNTWKRITQFLHNDFSKKDQSFTKEWNVIYHTTTLKQSLYMTGQTLSNPGGWGTPISWQSAHEGGAVVSSNTDRLYPPRSILGTHFCQWLSGPQGHSAAGRIMFMINSSNTIGIRTPRICHVMAVKNYKDGRTKT